VQNGVDDAVQVAQYRRTESAPGTGFRPRLTAMPDVSAKPAAANGFGYTLQRGDDLAM